MRARCTRKLQCTQLKSADLSFSFCRTFVLRDGGRRAAVPLSCIWLLCTTQPFHGMCTSLVVSDFQPPLNLNCCSLVSFLLARDGRCDHSKRLCELIDRELQLLDVVLQRRGGSLVDHLLLLSYL